MASDRHFGLGDRHIGLGSLAGVIIRKADLSDNQSGGPGCSAAVFSLAGVIIRNHDFSDNGYRPSFWARGPSYRDRKQGWGGYTIGRGSCIAVV